MIPPFASLFFCLGDGIDSEFSLQQLPISLRFLPLSRTWGAKNGKILMVLQTTDNQLIMRMGAQGADGRVVSGALKWADEVVKAVLWGGKSSAFAG